MAVSTGFLIFLLIAILFIVAIVVISVLIIPNLRGWVEDRAKGNQTETCTTDVDCRTYGLNSSWICDPPTKTCKIRPYTKLPCDNNTECAQITPYCTNGVCQQKTYLDGSVLEGDATKGCTNSLLASPNFNFCQSAINQICNTNDDCYQGACINGKCRFLNPLDECPGTSYASQPCITGLTCQIDTYSKGKYHCQVSGKGDGESGAYCTSNAQCQTGLVCHVTAAGEIGICGNQAALYGQYCTTSAECSPGLQCNTAFNQCVLLDLETDVTNSTQCPPEQYGSGSAAQGCTQGKIDAPCSSSSRCRVECSIDLASSNDHIDQLVMDIMGPDQVWYRIYPPASSVGNTQFLTDFFEWKNNIIVSKGINLLVPNLNTFTSRKSFLYPVLRLQIPSTHNFITTNVTEERSCPSYPSSDAAYSNLPMSSNNVVFNVNYDPTTISNSSITFMFPDSNPVVSGQGTQVTLDNDSLLTDYFYKESDGPSASDRYIMDNYLKFGNINFGTYTRSDGETNYFPSLQLYSMPPPVNAGIASISIADYYQNVLQFDKNTNVPQALLHFFYNPGPGETVTNYYFRTMPFRLSGGLITLIGAYCIQKGGSGYIVLSTLTLRNKLTSVNEVVLSRENTPMVLQQAQVVNNTLSGEGIYASIYSFIFIDFRSATTLNPYFPFTSNMASRVPPRFADAVGDFQVVLDVTNQNVTYQIGNIDDAGNRTPVSTKNGDEYTFSIFRPYSLMRGQGYVGANPTNTFWEGLAPLLSDFDSIVIDEVGKSAIVGLLFLFNNSSANADLVNIPMMATLRFGNVSYTNPYSEPYLPTTLPYGDANMFTFYYTPEPEETGGAFLGPGPSYNPSITTNITNWITSSTENLSSVQHYIRNALDSEVFTLTLVPRSLEAPLRFHRTPPFSDVYNNLVRQNLYILGRDVGTTNMSITPIQFDTLGAIHLFYDNASSGASPIQTYWASLSAPPFPLNIPVFITPGATDYVILKSNSEKIPSAPEVPWKIPQKRIVNLPSGFPTTGHFPINSFMCESSGFPDGLIYKARPYIYNDQYPFPPSGGAFPPSYVRDLSNHCPIEIRNFNDAAICSIYQSGTSASVEDCVRTSFFNTARELKVVRQRNGPMFIADVFSTDSNLAYVSMASESASGLQAASYKYNSQCVIPGAVPFSDSSYPTECVDYGTSEGSRPTPLMITYRTTTNFVVVLYNITIGRDIDGQYSVAVISKDRLEFDKSRYIYPVDFSGAPVVLYSGCL